MINTEKVFTAKWSSTAGIADKVSTAVEKIGLSDSARNFVDRQLREDATINADLARRVMAVCSTGFIEEDLQRISSVLEASGRFTEAERQLVLNSLGGVEPEDAEKIRRAVTRAGYGAYEPTTPFVDFQTNNGVVIPDTPTAIEMATQMFKDALGKDVDTTPETHVGRMIEQLGKNLASAVGFVAANVMQMDLSCATGQYLDAIASLFFEKRKTATRTCIVCEFSAKGVATEKINILSGSVIATDIEGSRFVLRGDVRLDEDNEYNAVGFLYAEKTGRVVPMPESKNMDAWAFTGIPSDVANPSAFTIREQGEDVESDDTFRARLKRCREKSTSFRESINSVLMSMPGVYDCHVVENATNETRTIGSEGDTWTLNPHSVGVVVSYDENYYREEADGLKVHVTKDIASAIYNYKSLGCDTVSVLATSPGNVLSIDVRDPFFGTIYPISFVKTVPITFDVKISVSEFRYAGSNIIEDVESAVRSWAEGHISSVDGLSIGQNIKPFEIGAAVSARIPDIQIDDVQIKLHSDQESQYSHDQIVIREWQIGTLGTVEVPTPNPA